ncbi:hypothetical protein Fmac_005034 [Flemingia macrophylla]|uniref:Uncharacterized protein n=1 Tax=Flemingia macrophylla TaxID=520843 RepID=A0ABD1N6M2_9FABA
MILGIWDMLSNGQIEGRKAGGEVRERVDRATASWFELFSLAVVKHLVASTSDHDPILLNSQGQPRVSRPQKK